MKTVQVRSCPVPTPSEISRRIAGASFYDSYAAPLQGSDVVAPAIALALRIFLNTPGWVGGLRTCPSIIRGRVGVQSG